MKQARFSGVSVPQNNVSSLHARFPLQIFIVFKQELFVIRYQKPSIVTWITIIKKSVTMSSRHNGTRYSRLKHKLLKR